MGQKSFLQLFDEVKADLCDVQRWSELSKVFRARLKISQMLQTQAAAAAYAPSDALKHFLKIVRTHRPRGVAAAVETVHTRIQRGTLVFLHTKSDTLMETLLQTSSLRHGPGCKQPHEDGRARVWETAPPHGGVITDRGGNRPYTTLPYKNTITLRLNYTKPYQTLLQAPPYLPKEWISPLTPHLLIYFAVLFHDWNPTYSVQYMSNYIDTL